MSNIFTAVCTLTRDAEVRYLPSGVAILTMSVANNQGYADKKTTIFIRVSLFGKRSEGGLINYLKKGQQVFVSGQLSQSEYRAKDGTMKASLELNANIVDLVGKRDEARQAPERQPPLPQGGYDNFDDDITF